MSRRVALCTANQLIRYHPQFTMFILCNDTPDIDGKDRRLARRIRKINFASQFTETKEPDLENHIYPINVDMSDVLRVWAPELMVLLLERFSPDYVYSCPSSIQQGTEEYMQENDKTTCKKMQTHLWNLLSCHGNLRNMTVSQSYVISRRI